MNGLLSRVAEAEKMINNFSAAPSTGKNASQLIQDLGMNPTPQNMMTGISPSEQMSMVTGRPEVGPTGMNPDQMRDIIGDISSSGIPMDQVMAAMSAIDSGSSGAQPMMPGQIFNNRGNVLVPGPMQQQPSLMSRVAPIMSMQGMKK